MEAVKTRRLQRDIAFYLQTPTPPLPPIAPRRRAEVIGLTGATLSGMKEIACSLRERRIASVGGGSAIVVSQSSYWRGPGVRVVLSDGRTVMSSEEPRCTDFDAMILAIDNALTSASLVIVEGASWLHDSRVLTQLGSSARVFLVHLSRETFIARHSSGAGGEETVVWPAHERHLARSVVPLANRIEHLDEVPGRSSDVSCDERGHCYAMEAVEARVDEIVALHRDTIGFNQTASSSVDAPLPPRAVSRFTDSVEALTLVEETAPAFSVHFGDVKKWPSLMPLTSTLLEESRCIGDFHFTSGEETPSDCDVLVSASKGISRETLPRKRGGAVVVPFSGVPTRVVSLFLELESEDGESDDTAAQRALFSMHHNCNAVVELATALLLAAARRLPVLDRALRLGDWTAKRELHTRMGGGVVLNGRTALILGYGSIGRKVAVVLRALGMRVIATRRTAMRSAAGGSTAASPALSALPPPVSVIDNGVAIYSADKETLFTLLPHAAACLICLPLTSSTRGLIDAEALSLLPPSAVVVNVGRAAIVDEAAMWAALQRDGGARLAFASDVWWSEAEKIPGEAIADLASLGVSTMGFDFGSLENVVLTPHCGGAPQLVGLNEARAQTLAALLRSLRCGGGAVPGTARCNLRYGY